MARKKFKLSSIIIFFVCLVVLFSLLVTDLLISNTVNDNIREDLEERATIISKVVAKSQVVKEGLENQEDADAIQAYTQKIQEAAGVLFVVVMDMDGIRKSHPNPDRIGKHFVGGDEEAVLKGDKSVSISTGTLGKSLRAFTPIYGENNEQVGAVAVGISLNRIEQALSQSHKNILTGTIIGILAGIIGAFILARYIKKALLKLEPHQIATILEERSTMLQSVHEGIVAVDKNSKITLVNKSAARLFKKAGLPDYPLGMDINQYMASSHLDRVLQTGKSEHDEEQNINGVSILVNRVPLVVQNEVVGAISTFRDKTEVNQLAEQLTGARTYAEALRAQSHEFMNRLHVILGMVRMGYYDELSVFIKKVVNHGTHEVGIITRQIKDPTLAGFLMGKLSYAREEGIELSVEIKEVIPEPVQSDISHELITILGNLIDNGIQALAEGHGKQLIVKLAYDDRHLIIEVSDAGSGLVEAVQSQIFEKGFSTKGEDRGFGLHLVKESVQKLNGVITVNSTLQLGTTFHVEVPYQIRGDEQ